MLSLRLNSHERKLLQEISYKRGLRPQVKAIFETETKYFLNFSKLLLTRSSECDQQLGLPLFQWNHVPVQQCRT